MVVSSACYASGGKTIILKPPAVTSNGGEFLSDSEEFDSEEEDTSGCYGAYRSVGAVRPPSGVVSSP